MVNDWWDVRFMGRYWEGGGYFEGRDDNNNNILILSRPQNTPSPIPTHKTYIQPVNGH